MAVGIREIHKLSMVHGSITLDKIFVDSTKGSVKIVDLFGVSQIG